MGVYCWWIGSGPTGSFHWSLLELVEAVRALTGTRLDEIIRAGSGTRGVRVVVPR
jgi:hypothetical protein